MTMTDDSDSVDELISRYLEGEATEAEITRVEGDPELLARAESVRAAIEAVAAPVAIPTAALDAIRAAAIAESPTTEQVTDLAAAAAAKRGAVERRNRFMAIAAAFVMLAVGVVAIQSLPGGDDDDESADTADLTTAEAASASDSADADTGADDGGDLSLETTDDSDDMAEEDDMSEEEEMADEEMAEDDSADEMEADEMAESAPLEDGEAGRDEGVDATQESQLFSAPDLLPAELPPFADTQTLVDTVLDGYVEQIDLEAGVGVADDELFAGLCPAAIELLDGAIPVPVTSVELLTTELAGAPTTVIVAVGEDGSSAVLTHPTADCAAVEVAAALEPS